MIRSLCGLLILCLALASCNDAPSEVGSVTLVDTLNAHTTSSQETPIFVSSAANFTRSWKYNDGRGQLFVGKTPALRAASMCRLGITDTTHGWVDASYIDSAVFLIRPRKFAIGSGNSDSTLSFAVVEMKNSFMQGSTSPVVTWPNLFTAGTITPNPVYFPKPNEPLATYKGTVRHDTLIDLALPMNTPAAKSVIATWLKRAATKDTTFSGFGILPLEDSKVVQEFATQNNYDSLPLVRIKVYIHDNANARDSLTIQSGNDVTYVDADTLQSPLMLVQPTLESTARLTADFSFIPAADALLKVELRFSIDETKTSYGSVHSADSLVVRPRYDSAGIPILINSYLAVKTAGTSEYVMTNLASAVDYARKHSSKPMYFDIEAYGQHLERHAVYDLTAPVGKRPRIVVTYATRPTIGVRK